MKKYINEQFLKNDFGYSSPDVDNQETPALKIDFYIMRASSRVDTLTGLAIEKGIRAGIYEVVNDLLQVVAAKFPDPNELATEEAKIDAVKEQIGVLTKFGIDTGYDFLTGSFSASIGSESFSDNIDFELSLKRVEAQIKEALALYDFGTILLEAETYKVAMEDEEDYNTTTGIIDGKDRPITTRQYETHHENDHITKGGGIVITKKGSGQVEFEIDPNIIDGDLSVPEDEIKTSEANISFAETFYDNDLKT